MVVNRLVVRALGLMVLTVVALTGTASAQVWTAVGSSGALRDTAAPTALAVDATLMFRGGATGNIWATYNVTNPRDIGNPAWTTLEFVARNSGTSLGATATAVLYRVPRGFSSSTAICVALAPAGGALSTSTCSFSSSQIDFANNSYYVQVALGRDNTSQTEAVYSLRLF